MSIDSRIFEMETMPTRCIPVPALSKESQKRKEETFEE